MIAIHHPWVFAFGLLGNVISFLVYLAPLPTFIRVYKKKSTQGFHSVPYVVAIFSAMLWIYYALLKGNSLLLITINSTGCVIETIYVAIFLTYAPKQAKISTLKLLMLLNFGGFCAIVLMCQYLAKGPNRLRIFGWVCVAFSICVFAAPLSVIKLVIRMKSVEFMPFNLSFALLLNATAWFMYGLLQKDLYITLPNTLGFVFGVAQIILYLVYRNHPGDQKLPEQLKAEATNDVIIPVDPLNSQPNHEETQKEGEGKMVKEISLPGPPQGPSCHVEADKMIVGGPPSVSVPVVECGAV